jgi:hypothetical protein
MKEILDKISSYNLFNYLFPGILFVAFAEKFLLYSFIQENNIIGIFVYYFIGLIISRIGSLVVEPALKKLSFLKFASYPDFVSASKQDEKIEIFSEINNMYRSISSVFILLLLFKIYEFIELAIPVLKEYNLHILIVLLLVMFLFSYKKQTSYIRSRVNKNLQKQL